jgi:2',3'-cyclic-nucleotide 2'-phosphodiesterase (5'-nucleotidase family)
MTQETKMHNKVDAMTYAPAARLLQITLISLLLLVSQAVAADNSPSADLRFTILHTNDLHAHDDAFSDRGKLVGGMSRIAHAIQEIRREKPNVVVVDAGDIFQGTPYFKLYHGEVEVESLNKAGYDIFTIGNHEFDDGATNLAKQLSRAKFDVISANLDTTAMPALNKLVKPSTIKTFNGQKVGFVGAITHNLRDVALNTEGVVVKSPADATWTEPIKEEVERLKKQGVDKIIMVTHCGVEDDKDLAEAIPDIDIIVGGHSHTRLDKIVYVPHEDGSRTAIVQTGCYGRALGRLDVAFDSKGQLDVPATKYKLINIREQMPEHPEVKAYLNEKVKPFLSLRNTVAGISTGEFDNQFRLYPWDSPIGNLITDALAEGGSKYGATIALQNRGGIRGRIDRGMITAEKLDEVLPFENHLIIATVSGATLTKALENSVSGNLGARFLDVHGLKVQYDPRRKAGERLVSVQAQGQNGKWSDLKPDGEYRIAINSYSFNGGEGYDFKGAKDVVETGKRLSAFMQDYLVKHQKVAPQRPSRISPVGITSYKQYRQVREAMIQKYRRSAANGSGR